MKYLILSLVFSLALPAYAGSARVRWTHEHRAVDGSTITPTGFNLYWGLQGQPVSQMIATGPISPWQSVSGVYHYSRTFTHANWTPGATVCFQMSALAGELQSGRSNQVCRVMPSDPAAPVIIVIENP